MMNEFISWDPAKHYNIVRVDLDDKVMWIPDIIFFTQLTGDHFNAEFPAPPAILFDGMMMVLKPFKAEIVCIMDVWYFPFDQQKCSFDVGSWAHLASEIDIVPKEPSPTDLSFFQPSATFKVTNFSAFYNRYADPTLETDDNEFSCLVFTLEFSRQPTYFVMNVIMPSVLINCLCVLNFGVPHETGEKVGYGITVFLAQSVNLMVVSEMMPQGGTSVLGIFLVCSILLIGLSLTMQIISLSCYHGSKNKRASKVTRFILYKVNKVLGPRLPRMMQPGNPYTNFYRMDNSPLHGQVGRTYSSEYYGNFNLTSNEFYPNSNEMDSKGKNGTPYVDKNLYETNESSFIKTGTEYTNGRLLNTPNNGYPSDGTTYKNRTSSLQIPSILEERGVQRGSTGEVFPFDPSGMSGNPNEMQPFVQNVHNMSDWGTGLSYNEAFIIDEWKLLAETLNRMNALLFVMLLSSIGGAYMYFRSI
ncbi:neuronal acetylcholine receptor subunit alpha-2-like isoform X2 [Convolutriloba macropyga]|uniref:neuronal acetylcholine receptor subunit alpha-2-like isoform X2 n=1 Tax=Convolutriloba macropyga TaxID=536237 RepID=UPI003F521153